MTRQHLLSWLLAICLILSHFIKITADSVWPGYETAGFTAGNNTGHSELYNLSDSSDVFGCVEIWLTFEHGETSVRPQWGEKESVTPGSDCPALTGGSRPRGLWRHLGLPGNGTSQPATALLSHTNIMRTFPGTARINTGHLASQPGKQGRN